MNNSQKHTSINDLYVLFTFTKVYFVSYQLPYLIILKEVEKTTKANPVRQSIVKEETKRKDLCLCIMTIR